MKSIKSMFRNILRSLFGTSWEINDLEIKFHTEANAYGSHGRMLASHVDFKLKNAQVRFVFIGMSTPPAMTPMIMNYIWDEAKIQGFLPHSLVSYGETLIAETSLTTETLTSIGGGNVLTVANRQAA